MGNMTSLYLCNRIVQAVVGRGSGRKVSIDSFCQAELPEGCLINGVVTNEAALIAALKEFVATNNLPTKNVGLVLNSSQTLHRTMTLPTLPDKKLRTVVSRELNSGSEVLQPLDDYMLLARSTKDHTDTLLATRLEKSLIDSMMAVAQGAGLSVSCIDLALACEIKLISFLPSLKDKTFIMLVFDGDNVYSGLFENGMYKYSTRNRLFNTRGTPESAAEILQKVSGILQFQLASKSQFAITDVYFAGADADDVAACAPGIAGLQLQAALFPDMPDRVALPQGCALAESVFTVGNLVNR